MKHLIASIIALMIFTVFTPTITYAQPPDLDDDPGVPIDGGASLLVGAAAVYGAKKLREKKK